MEIINFKIDDRIWHRINSRAKKQIVDDIWYRIWHGLSDGIDMIPVNQISDEIDTQFLKNKFK